MSRVLEDRGELISVEQVCFYLLTCYLILKCQYPSLIFVSLTVKLTLPR